MTGSPQVSVSVNKADHQSHELCQEAKFRRHQLHRQAYNKDNIPTKQQKEAVKAVLSSYSKTEEFFFGGQL